MPNLKICFLGLKSAIDYFQIGGTESFVRRLAIQMIKNGYKVDCILYGSEKNEELDPVFGLRLRYFDRLEDAFACIPGEYDHIISMYFLPKDKLRYDFFRKRYENSLKFHFVYFNWPDFFLKRALYFKKAKVFPYNGKLFCISKRQYDVVKKWAKNAVYILPPVPEGYFVTPEQKSMNEKIKLTFLGRIDPGKGIEDVIKLFDVLKNNQRFECAIYGIYRSEDKESYRIHRRLKEQKEIKYFEFDRTRYSPETEDTARQVLKKTDVFIQPYKKLSSTIDTPFLLLEAMASLCPVITKAFGNIPDIYGRSQFLIPADRSTVEYSLRLLNNIRYEDITDERKRIFERNKKLNFKAESITGKFMDNLKECR